MPLHLLRRWYGERALMTLGPLPNAIIKATDGFHLNPIL